MSATDTPTRLLDTAQALVQERGFNAFSYKDLEAAVGIRTASIHYHFKTKGDLGKALMVRYIERLNATLGAIDRDKAKNKARLKEFIGLYRTTQKEGIVCLCGSLAADLQTLPDDLKVEVATYLDTTEKWVTAKLRAGVRAGEFVLGASAASLATTLVAGLQGSLILSRAQNPTSGTVDHIESSFFSALQKP